MNPASKNLLQLFLWVLIIFGMVDAMIWIAERKTNFLEDVVDIQTPATLYSKLDYLRKFDGHRIAFMGDSVVYGRRMEEFGDADWRNHTIPAHVASELEAMFPQQKFLTMNLAMNGALPADIEQMARLISSLKPDCIVADISLRAFSADFTREDTSFSRPWLSNMRIDGNFNLHTEKADWDLSARLEAVLQDFALSHWRLYRLRDFFQWRIFNSEPSAAVQRLRDRFDQELSAEPTNEADPLDDLLLTLKAKSRHESITLASWNLQVIALKRTLEQLSTDKQCALFFYATEEKKQVVELIEPQRYQRLQTDLAKIFAPYAASGVIYIPPLDSIKSEYYLDYGHLNDFGNAIVARNILEGGLGRLLGHATRMP